MDKPTVVAVVGATASGKTALGVDIAEYYGGEVISGDSMQIYRGLDIATAKPTAEEMRGVPHYLISVLPPDQPCSVAEYVEMARAKIAEVQQRGKLPVIVGGTGLYVDSLLDNIQFPDIPADDAVRERLNREADTLGRGVLLERLRRCDAESAAKLHENNLRRIVRALEVYELTGTPLSEFARQSRAVPPPWNAVRVGICFDDRELQYQRIRQRVDMMLEMGLLDEVRAEYESGTRRATAAMAIGYKELIPYLEGNAPLDTCISSIKQETCRYAKRQGTWFRRNEQICWIHRDGMSESAEIFSKLKNDLFLNQIL